MARPTLSPLGIRTDLVSRLQGRTMAGIRVFDSRQLNYEADEFPAIVVSTLGGGDDGWGLVTLLAKHEERAVVVGEVRGTEESAVAATLDEFEGQILDTLAGDPEWVGAFEGVEKIDIAKKIDGTSADLLGKVAVVLTLKYTVTYVQNPALLPDLDRVAVDTHPTSPAGANVSDRLILGTPAED